MQPTCVSVAYTSLGFLLISVRTCRPSAHTMHGTLLHISKLPPYVSADAL